MAIELVEGGEKTFQIPQRVNLAEAVADSIARAVATGLLSPNERLTEVALSESIGVSRAPVREALKILHVQGIVTSENSRGFRVAAFDEDTIAKVLELRLVLETILLRDAIAFWKSSDPAAAALNLPIAKMHEASVNDDRAASLEADLSFHRAIAEASQNQIALTLWSAIARHVMIIFSMKQYRADDLVSVVRHHEELRDFIRTQIKDNANPDGIRTTLEHHLLQISIMRGQ